MALVRYRALGEGMVPHPTKAASFVGWERLADAKTKHEFAVPDGFRYRRAPDGEAIHDSGYLRTAMRDGHLELLPLESPAPKKVKADNG